MKIFCGPSFCCYELKWPTDGGDEPKSRFIIGVFFPLLKCWQNPKGDVIYNSELLTSFLSFLLRSSSLFLFTFDALHSFYRSQTLSKNQTCISTVLELTRLINVYGSNRTINICYLHFCIIFKELKKAKHITVVMYKFKYKHISTVVI